MMYLELEHFLMKPYGHRELQRDERIYDFRNSRGRRVVDRGAELC